MDWIAYAALVLSGIFALYGLISDQSKKKRKSIDSEQEKLNSIFKERLTLMEKSLSEAETKLDKSESRINTLKIENSKLTEILGGSFKNHIENQDKILELIKELKEVFQIYYQKQKE